MTEGKIVSQFCLQVTILPAGKNGLPILPAGKNGVPILPAGKNGTQFFPVLQAKLGVQFCLLAVTFLPSSGDNFACRQK